jgi:membrane protein implicated in regulation of membrane protease activity
MVSGEEMPSVSRWSVVGFAAAFAGVALALYVFWPVGVAVGLAVGISLLAVIQRRLLQQEHAEYLDERAEVEDLLGSLLTR